jgi:hypothetical protein
VACRLLAERRREHARVELRQPDDDTRRFVIRLPNGHLEAKGFSSGVSRQGAAGMMLLSGAASEPAITRSLAE